MTQCEKIIDYIDKHGEITQRDAIGLGCYRLAARIHDLKEDGIKIDSFRRTVINADGSESTIGVYRRSYAGNKEGSAAVAH